MNQTPGRTGLDGGVQTINTTPSRDLQPSHTTSSNRSHKGGGRGGQGETRGGFESGGEREMREMEREYRKWEERREWERGEDGRVGERKQGKGEEDGGDDERRGVEGREG